jgi:uncharacterized protein YecT (DUF1311 family)
MHRHALALLALTFSAQVAQAKPFHCAGLTQHEMNVCAHEELRKSEAALDRALDAARTRLDGEQRDKLELAEKAWERFRAAECEARCWPSHTGSIYPMQRALCLADLARGRKRAIEELPLP